MGTGTFIITPGIPASPFVNKGLAGGGTFTSGIEHRVGLFPPELDGLKGSIRGHTRGQFMVVPPAGKSISSAVIHIIRFRGWEDCQAPGCGWPALGHAADWHDPGPV